MLMKEKMNMNMTEKMKQALKESVRIEGVALSDEQLDEVTGGRAKTEHEEEVFSDRLWEQWSKPGLTADENDLINRNARDYLRYIRSLPDGSPEVLFDPAIDYGALLKQ